MLSLSDFCFFVFGGVFSKEHHVSGRQFVQRFAQ